MNIYGFFERIRLSFYLFVAALIAFFGSPDDFKIPAFLYFGSIEVLLYGDAGLDRFLSVTSSWSKEVKVEEARPNKSLVEYGVGERP